MKLNKTQILKKWQKYQENPEVFSAPTNEEVLAIAFHIISAVSQIEGAIKEGRLDGYSPKPGKDFEPREATLKAFEQFTNETNTKVDKKLSELDSELNKAIREVIESVQDGEDGFVTDEEIQRAAQMAYEMIQWPDFDALIEERITANPMPVRDSLETILEEEDKLEQSAIKNLPKDLDDIRAEIRKKQKGSAGSGIGKSTVLQLIAENAGSGSVSDEAYSSSWNGDTTTAPSKNAVYDKIESLAGGHDPVTVTDTATINHTLTGQDLQSEIIDNSVTFAKMQDIAADHFIGRYTSGSGDPQQVSAAQARTILGLGAVATSNDYNDLTNLPDLSALNDVGVYADLASFPATGNTDFVYIASDTGYMYRWNGSSYTQLTDQTAIWGQISGTLSNQTDLQSALDTKQGLNAALTSIAGLTTAADRMIYTTGSDTYAVTTLTAAARTVLDDTTVSAMVDTLGGAAATGTGGLVRSISPTFTGTPVLPSTFTIGANSFIRTGAHNLTLTTSATTNATFPSGTITLVGTTATQTLSNKTLTAPRIANNGFIADANGNEQIIFTTTTSAVNELTIANAATGNSPTILASGGDANIDLTLTPKGSGKIITSGDLQVDTDTLYVDATNDRVGIGVSTPLVPFEVSRLGSAVSYTPIAGTTATFHHGGAATASPSYVQILAGNASKSGVYFGDTDDLDIGGIIYNHAADEFDFRVSNSSRMYLTSTGLGIGTSSPAQKLHVTGDSEFNGDLQDVLLAGFKLVDKGNVTGATTIDWNDGAYQKITLTGNTTLSFTAPTGHTANAWRLQLDIYQDVTGGRTLTLPTVQTPGGAGYTVSSAASARDIVTIYYDGSTYALVDSKAFS